MDCLLRIEYEMLKFMFSFEVMKSLFSSKGNFEDIQDAGSLHEFLINLHEEYGGLASFWWGSHLVVSLGSPEMFQEVKALFDRPSISF